MNRRYLLALSLSLVAIISVPLSGTQQQQQKGTAPGASSTPPSQPAAPPPAGMAAPDSAAPTAASAAPAKPAAPLTPQAQALMFYRTGKFDAAIDAYTKLASADPGAAYAGLTRVYLQQKRTTDAYAAVNKAIELAPKSSDVHVALAEVYYRQGKIIEADRELVAVVNSGSRTARAYLDLARIAETASYYARAKTMIETAHRLDPDDPDVRREWLNTLPREQRVKELQDYLSGDTDDDAKDRAHLTRMLTLLQQEAGQPHRGCRQVNSVTSTQISLEPLWNSPSHIRGYGLMVNVNGTNAKLMLDTGAGGILVDRVIAEKAGIKPIVHTEVNGIGSKGASGGYLGFADTIKVGELEFHDCVVEVVEKRSVLNDQGLIGADVFQHYLIDINLPDAKFGLSQLPKDPKETSDTASLEANPAVKSAWRDPYIAPEMKSYSGVYRVGHMLLIPTALNDKPPKLFLIDTGAFDNMIDTGAAKEVTKIRNDEYDRVKGLNGDVAKVYTADKVKIRFSRFQQDRQDLIAFDLSNISDGAGTEVSGTLGFAMLRMLDIKIDYRDGMVDFTYDKNRSH
jgi:tetratricopeptide (TPR) repeat protein